MSATKSTPRYVSPSLEPLAPIIDLDSHVADLARRRTEHDAKAPELMKCLHHVYASQKEISKPHYQWTVSATWYGPGDDGIGEWTGEERTVYALNEGDAWAAYCDAIETWPSRRDAKVNIKRGRELSMEEVITLKTDDVTQELPKYTRSKPSKRSKLKL